MLVAGCLGAGILVLLSFVLSVVVLGECDAQFPSDSTCVEGPAYWFLVLQVGLVLAIAVAVIWVSAVGASVISGRTPLRVLRRPLLIAAGLTLVWVACFVAIWATGGVPEVNSN